MYCPGCGQQQMSDQMRFCSRCGLPIGGLAEWVAGGGAPSTHAAEKKISARSPQRKGIRLGAKVMFFSGILFPVLLALSLAIGEGGPMILPVAIFFVGLAIMLYSRLFREDIPTSQSELAQISRPGTMSEVTALPPAPNIPIHGPAHFTGSRVRTNELIQRPSVTENTTKLLDEE